jgi:hypothetical protein
MKALIYLLLAFRYRKIFTAILETVFIVHGGYLLYPSVLIGNNHFYLPFLYLFHIFIFIPSFSLISFSCLVRSSFPLSVSFKLKQLPYHHCSIPLSIFYLHLLTPFMPYLLSIQCICLSCHHSCPVSSNGRRQFELSPIVDSLGYYIMRNFVVYTGHLLLG